MLCMILFFTANAVLAGMNHCLCAVKEACGCEAPPAQTCGDEAHEHPSPASLGAPETCSHAVIPQLTLPDRWDDDDDAIPFPAGTLFSAPPYAPPFPLETLLIEARGRAPPPIAPNPDRRCFGIAIACRC